MEQMKNALTALEAAVIRLESAVHHSNKNRTRAAEQVQELKAVIKTAYERLDRAVTVYKNGGE